MEDRLNLEINSKQFNRLPVKQQNTILFENSKAHINSFKEFMNMFEGHLVEYKQHLKEEEFNFKFINWVLGIGGAIITALVGYIMYIVSK